MAEKTITILIVSYNSADFIEISLHAISKLTFNNYEVRIIDNNSQYSDFMKLQKIVEKYPNVYLTRENTNFKGSLAHGTALNKLVKKVDTPYFSILDADAVWLKKNWDQILISKLDDKIKVIGSKAPLPKPQDFPLMFGIVFETATFKKLDIDFRPKDLTIHQDTGHELREKYFQKNFVGLSLPVKNTRDYKKGPFSKLIGVEEYYLSEDLKELILSHFGRGSTLGAQKYIKNTIMKYVYSLPMIGPFLLRKKGFREKNKWLKICKKITDSQITG